MAAKFYDSTAVGAATGASWADAYTAWATAAAGLAAGDTLWVSDLSAESLAGAIAATFPGTVGNPNFIYCVDHTKASPGTGDLKTTATVTTTGANALTNNGSFYCYGITFSSGSGATNTALTICSSVGYQIYEACQLAKLGTTANTSAISFGGSNISTRVKLVNTTIKFGAVGDAVVVNGGMVWQNTASAIAGSLPTTLFAAARNGIIVLEGIDLSALGAGKTIHGAANSARALYLKDCKLGSSVTVAAAPTDIGPETFVIRSDSGATNYRCEKYSYRGTETTETTIVRTGGASDGTTPQSRKITTTANSLWVAPFEALPIVFWNDTITGNITLTLEGTINAGAVPNNDEIWIDAEYLGSASIPLGSFATQTKANNLATGSALTASAAAWGGGGSGVGWSPFKLTVTIVAPAQKGPITVYVKAAKATTNYYVDPIVTAA